MNVFGYFRQEIIEALDTIVSKGQLPSGLDYSRVTAEVPREHGHGDISTNAAMVLAKAASKAPHEIAQSLIEILAKHKLITACSVAGPGFINLTIADDFWRQRLAEIVKIGVAYGDSNLGEGEKVNVEYVSANPTGPLHVGHCRGAIVGDVLASVLQKAGYEVVRESYVNDAGSQADHLARSVYNRYCQVLGHKVEIVGEYPGEYLIPVAKKLVEKDSDKWLGKPESEWLDTFRTFAVEAMMALICKDLDLIGIHQDVFTSEKSLIEKGEVDAAFEFLQEHDLIYTGVLERPKGKQIDDWEPRPQTLFKSTKFGDDVDRPMKKSDGGWTYFSSDIAYHFNKARRGFTRLIDVLGADHVGYVKRIAAATSAITEGKIKLEVKLCQMVRFMDNGEIIKMSKRTGTYIPVADLVNRVGRDVVRFIMLTRKNDAPIDFDFAKVVEQSKDNPVFYVQYAHARTCSVQRHVKELFPELDISKADLNLITHADEINLIKRLTEWPNQIEGAAIAGEPHRLAFFLHDLAACFHAIWTKGRDHTELRFIYPDNVELTKAKLALLQALQNVVASGLQVFGVQPVEEM